VRSLCRCTGYLLCVSICWGGCDGLGGGRCRFWCSGGCRSRRRGLCWGWRYERRMSSCGCWGLCLCDSRRYGGRT
jgi:hypothetical protein